MNKQRVVRVTITYNDMGIITDVKAEEEGAVVRENVRGECGVCGFWKSMGHMNFCPNCGADMRGGDAE